MNGIEWDFACSCSVFLEASFATQSLKLFPAIHESRTSATLVSIFRCENVTITHIHTARCTMEPLDERTLTYPLSLLRLAVEFMRTSLLVF